ncbi:hypothetical protein B7755_015000 [Streptomyces sp. NBS 14/10]|uniref:hypothetical protein n=1 Tax=Streptomyces sp. NBS 14/10 TaxID=1945643 RepID=UPI0015C59B47|nr:hypothetical protein [Streptomyces sp. NBS 14/10]KAK1179334.1 hypothetical protein B7755_015000 [Streptomyces sp. NBS 14/10]
MSDSAARGSRSMVERAAVSPSLFMAVLMAVNSLLPVFQLVEIEQTVMPCECRQSMPTNADRAEQRMDGVPDSLLPSGPCPATSCLVREVRGGRP